MSTTYEVIKFYEDGRPARRVRGGLDIEQAQAICNDPETSSYSAQKPLGCDRDEIQIARWHEKQRHWFYGFREEHY